MVTTYLDACEARVQAIMAGANEWRELLTREEALQVIAYEDVRELQAREYEPKNY